MTEKIIEHDIFNKTRGYTNWFCENFGTKLPYSKMDIIFLPDLNGLSMGHVGGITLDDRYVQRSMNPIDYDDFNLMLSQGM